MKEVSRVTKNTTKSTLDPAGFTSKDKGGAPAAAPAPAIAMPDDEATKAAQRRKVASMAQRGGRASTVLSGDDRLGG